MKLLRQTATILLLTTASAVLACNATTERSEAPAPGAGAAPAFPRVVARTYAERVNVSASELPAPFATEAVGNPPTVVDAPANASFELPAGFSISVFAEGDFQNPRWMIEGANGDIFLSDAKANHIVLLRDTNKDGKIDNSTERFVLVEGLNRPFGMAIQNDWFYIGNADAVVRYKYEVGSTKLAGKPEKIADLPAGEKNNHWTRNLLFSRDGKKLYVTVGSASNVEVEKDQRRAAISEYNPDGSGHRIFASGIRNPVGLAWNPTTSELWTAVNERDGLGDDLVPDYATSVKDGGFYGWPYLYIGKNIDPRRKDDVKPQMLEKVIVPDVLFEAHAASLGIAFYTGNMFPGDYQGDAFVAMHGSWNRSQRHGYKIAHIPFRDGKPEGGYEDFLTGWVPDPAKKEVWGRPVGLLVHNDGSLLITDDGGKKVWRVTYKQ